MNEEERSPKPPRVSILVLTWNGKEDLLECLASLEKLRYGNFETIVIDNASYDGTAEEVRRRYPAVAVLENNADLGYAGGNNAGIRFCAGRGAEYYFLLNNDLVVEPGCLRELIAVAERMPRGGIFGPKTYKYGSDRVLDFTGGVFDWRKGRTRSVGVGEPDTGQYDEVKEYDFMNGHALLIRRAVTDTIGLLDEDYFMYNEETDWCARARKAGYASVYVPRAVVWHKVSRSGLSISRSYLITRNQILFMRKNASAGRVARFLLDFAILQFPMRIASCVKHGNWRELRAFVQAIGWHAGLWRKRNPFAAMLEEGRRRHGRS